MLRLIIFSIIISYECYVFLLFIRNHDKIILSTSIEIPFSINCSCNLCLLLKTIKNNRLPKLRLLLSNFHRVNQRGKKLKLLTKRKKKNLENFFEFTETLERKLVHGSAIILLFLFVFSGEISSMWDRWNGKDT